MDLFYLTRSIKANSFAAHKKTHPAFKQGGFNPNSTSKEINRNGFLRPIHGC